MPRKDPPFRVFGDASRRGPRVLEFEGWLYERKFPGCYQRRVKLPDSKKDVIRERQLLIRGY